MNSLKQVVARNNQATDQLQSGKSCTTNLTEFERIIRMLGTISLQLADEVAPVQDAVVFQFEPGRTTHACLTFFSPHWNTVDGFQSDHGFVYNRLLRLSTDAMVHKGRDFDTILRLTSATVLFNAALLWHSRGKVLGRALALKRAGQLYDMVLTVLERTDGTNVDNPMGVLECLALNNLAQIHHELGEYAKSFTSMEYLRGNLSAGGYGHLDAYLDSFDSEEIQFNAAHLQYPLAASAA